MNTIRNYLDNMFLGLPQTEDVARAKKELLAMMEDKYNELKNEGKTENEAIGIVISEFGNLDELGDTLGIKQVIENKTDIPLVTYEEAKNYIEESRAVAPKTALGVLLCIISPVTLLLLIGLKELGVVGVKEELLIAAGLVVLICLVATGVLHFIRYTSKLEKYEYLKFNVFELDYKAEEMVRNIQKQDEPTYKAAVSISVVCYILSALPVIVTPLVSEIDGLSVIAVTITLIIVALSTYNLINKSSYYEPCNVLLQQGDYSVRSKSNKTFQTVSKVYWCVVVAVYLGYSFITNNWAMSWIIWPVAGVLFGAIKAISEGR
ncbi:MAG: permease prefix domain 1-containing protein [Sedimentibacter saalensis]|uniref:permease prefix domain 1-containing protein n=1 Tax=Sedimentibacter saalensis TaxID=130788 RepID=UPI002B201ACF|nr:permease prefix domain 1-containing protein [Sedimentibacter saalensis]MEA5094098.1 permease prefix domain 1-containing protein [Sedimentibacter saalensis]